MKETAIVVCPGRGTYNAGELGYLTRHHGARSDFVESLDALRRDQAQPTLTALDGADTFRAGLHMSGDNASLLIYACALADFAAINRDRYDIVAVTGNSMGWYLTLACAGALSLLDAGRLVNEMGALMHTDGVGGQVIYPMVDEDWRPDPAKQKVITSVLEKARATPGVDIRISIKLGGLLVFAANDQGLAFLAEELPVTDRYPMRLNYHAAFHSGLLDHILPMAKARNSASHFGDAHIPMIDGKGRLWSPSAYDPDELYDYTLGAQINETYNFTCAIDVAVKEFAPDRVIVLGPGTTLGAPVAQALICDHWRGIESKTAFTARQKTDPLILSMGICEQRSIVVSEKS